MARFETGGGHAGIEAARIGKSLRSPGGAVAGRPRRVGSKGRGGFVRLLPLLRDVVAIRWTWLACGTVPLGLPVALYLLPQPGYVAFEGRHLCLAPAGA